MILELASLLLLVAVLIVCHRVFSLSTWYNPLVLFLAYHVVFLYMGLLYRSLYSDVVAIQTSVVLMIWTGLMAVTAGGITARVSLAGTSALGPITPGPVNFKDPKLKIAIAKVIFAAGVGVTLLYFWTAGAVPMLADDAENFRIEARMGKGFLVLIAIALLKYSTYILTALKMRSGHSVRSVLPYIATADLMVIGIGNRAPALELILFSVLVIYLVRKRKFRIWSIVLLGLAIMVAMALLGIVRQGLTMSTLMVWLQMLWRPFANIQNLQWVYDTFPDKQSFLYGYSYVIDLAVLLPGYSPNFGTWFKEKAGLDFAGGSVTVSYLGETYSNFGWPGVVVLSFLLGFVLVYLYVKFARFRRESHFMLLIICATTLKSIVSSGIMSVLMYETMILLLVHGVFVGSSWLAREVTREVADVRAS